MNVAEALAGCQETVRRVDPDRFFATLFAPADRRPLLYALYAFHYEVARAGEHSREPMMGAIRLQWWREAAEEARQSRPRGHPVAIGLAEVFARTGLPPAGFDALFDAREFDIDSEPFADMPAFEAYCDATSSGLMRAAAHVLGAREATEPLLAHAGIAYAITGLLRAIPFHAVRQKLYLPRNLLEDEGLRAEDLFAGRGGPALKRVVRALAARARWHLHRARGTVPARLLPAVLPASLCALYLRKLARDRFDHFRDSPEVPLFVRQLVLLRAATFGRV